MTETSKQKRNVHRSPAYPSIDLERAIPLAEKLYSLFDEDPFARDVAIKEIGLKVGGDSNRKLAALVHFGLINRKGSNYQVTFLTKKIVFPDPEDELARQNAIIEAVQNPKLYKNLISAYIGKNLPPTFYYKLINDQKFNKDVAERVAINFKKSIEFAGILKNGIVSTPLTKSTTIEKIPEQLMPSEKKVTGEINKNPPIAEQPSNGGINFPLGQHITLIVSENFSRNMFFNKDKYEKFTKILDELKELDKKEEDGDAASTATSTPLE